ncbi:MAG: helix-turn-helix domain-containing protein [Verrucomicrobiales bacterium]
MKTDQRDDKHRIFEKLQESSLYQTYRRAFRDATGLPLVMAYAEQDGWHPCLTTSNQNKFCQLLNEDGNVCKRCVQSDRNLCDEAGEKTRSLSCFAGLTETVVPVRCGRTTVGFLKTGQVFNRKPSREQVGKMKDALKEMGFSSGHVAKLTTAYHKSEVIDRAPYHGMITILTAFAMQLGELANRILLERSEREPALVTNAKNFIMEHLDEPLSLDMVASHVNVSSFYFCKLFKQATSLTFTEYVNRQRIEWAKRKLLERNSRVTEVAFDVGYQSLSQFNRSFSKIVGESPTQYRVRMSRKEDLLVA